MLPEAKGIGVGGIAIKGNAAAFVGLVKASDERTAIKATIAEFKIINPEHQKRLVARRQS